jgi:dienelactone hydrolase
MSSISLARPLRILQGLAILSLVIALAPARGDVSPASRANYRQAEKYSKKKVDSITYSLSVTPNWIGKTDVFWYSYRTSKGTAFWRVDPAKKSKTELFNREKLAAQLAELSRKPAEANDLPLTRTSMNADGTTFSFVFNEMLYEYDLKTEKLVSKGKAPAAPTGPAGPGGLRGRRRVVSGAEDAESQCEADDEPQQKDKEKGKTEDRTKGRRGGGGAGGAGAGAMRAARVPSPDGKCVLFTKDHNLYVSETGKEKEARQLTRDGAEEYTFLLGGGFGGQGGGRGGLRAFDAIQRPSPWSSDSKYFYATRQDSRKIQELFLVDSLGTPRPKLEKYPYPMPGEDAIRKTELYIGSRDAKEIVRVAPKWRDESYRDLRWSKTSGELRFVRMDRLIRNLELCALDAGSAVGRTLISEGFESAPVEYQPPRYLEETGEMIWWSERSGWGHYYLYTPEGKLKNPITTGSWRASRIVALDEKSRTLWVAGNGREKGENIYYEHLYAVKLDGTGLTLLNPGNASHPSLAGFGGMGGRGFGAVPGMGALPSMLSPSRQFLVDNSNRIDQAPVSVLRDDRGNEVMKLEEADLSKLREYGWRPPDTFVVKAGDGVTDLYGNMWKPFDFNPKKKYPIIADVYPGPQMEGTTHTFSAYSRNMQLAQLGFIVIQVGHRGGTPTRSKAYASYGYFNLRDYALADKKIAIEQLAARYPWIDLKNVGIFGHSGGGFMTAAALLQKPYNEFFKAGVASAGNHDNNIYNNTWAERYHGMKAIAAKEVAKKEAVKDATKRPPMDDGQAPVAPPAKGKVSTPPPPTKAAPAAPPATKFEIKVPTNTELAANLKGHLLLVHGEIDNNVHPANTMRLVDALIKANKRFDMLILPGQRHGFGTAQRYFNQRMMEFFAEHLLGDRRTGADIFEGESE